MFAVRRCRSPLPLACLTFLLTATGCGAGDALMPTPTGRLRIQTATHGGLDSNGYVVSINGDASTIGTDDSLRSDELQPAPYQVALLDVAEPCSVRGSNPQSALVVASLTTTIRFEIDCGPPEPVQGALQVIVATTGVDLDQDGYTLYVDSSTAGRVELNDTLLIEDLPSGLHLVRLAGLAQNCTISAANPDSISVTAGATTGLHVEVGCWPPLNGAIAYSHGFEGGTGRTIEVLDAERTAQSPLFFLTPPEFASSPSWSPDGFRIAYVSDDGFTVNVWVSAADFTAVELAGCQPTAPRPVWSPDGIRILCRSADGELFTQARTGADVQPVAPSHSGVASAGWSSTGAIAFRVESEESTDAELYLMDTPMAVPRRLLAFQNLSLRTDGVPQWSPDGTLLAFPAVVPSPDIGGPSVSEVRILNPATSAVTVVSPKGSVARDLSWSPDGRYLVFEAAGIWRVRADGTDLRRLTEGDSPSWSPDGFRLAFTRIEFLRQSVQSSIFIMNSDGTDVRRLTVDDALNADPAWAP
jgi:hypothetical protein